MTRAAAGNNPLRFGEVAVALGVLTPEQVERGLGEQVCGIITRSLQRGESQWDFEPPRRPGLRARSPWRSTRPSWRRCDSPRRVDGRPHRRRPPGGVRGGRRLRGREVPGGSDVRGTRAGAHRRSRDARGANGRRAGVPEGDGAASRRGRRRRRRSSCVAPPGCSPNPSSTCSTPPGPRRAAGARSRARPSGARCSRSRRGRSGAIPCSLSDRTSSGRSRCGGATTPPPRNGSTRR